MIIFKNIVTLENWFVIYIIRRVYIYMNIALRKGCEKKCNMFLTNVIACIQWVDLSDCFFSNLARSKASLLILLSSFILDFIFLHQCLNLSSLDGDTYFIIRS
ncbi:hypothetical protein NG271_089 [Saccharomyces cerevisiae synthetic construct]|uniref:Putative uncharacterized protein YDL158C n=1 Tax=Saccharomyces cerevisiae (strain ATCC 204508 / S288c) TaxID=559292 RepID=YD158_YEAST|nr:RecName: Full=Putative uncharacterized protein YDL158C [Saccharomyces cerevisiae S288C]KZV12068.1 hypothetical protein WN66_00882 [Saccharomyces cerevisiae]WNF19648.1 hypothetical protein NG271_089 [Saccharomyces cerevisiae synthetic construct]CAA66333.1 unnamed protein product [Saccharomyces cerevisiae]CAA91588.1 putative protein [Saccharomyces cerevisiae]CAA98733.1 unnamed protein product [Saccharomyces cerevisiae]